MGIELELHSERPTVRSWELSRRTLLRGSYEHGEQLAAVLAQLKFDDSAGLRRVDPYDDTFFDSREAAVALGEVPTLLRLCGGSEREAAAVHDLASMLQACVATAGSCLWFVGD